MANSLIRLCVIFLLLRELAPDYGELGAVAIIGVLVVVAALAEIAGRKDGEDLSFPGFKYQ